MRQPLLRLAAATLSLLALVHLCRAQSDSSQAAPPRPPRDEPAQRLDAVNVNGDRYKPVNELSLRGGNLLGVAIPAFPIPQSDAWLMGSVIVTATRTPKLPERVAATTRAFDLAALRASPTATIDSTLRALPSFSLLRRSDSLTANPTTQGVSLRGLGPSGASRSLVLLDGVPLNDPFGGWINWSIIPRDALAKVEVVPGGGASAWGNAALGGVIQLFTLPPRTTTVLIDRPPAPITTGERGTAQVTGLVGDFDTRSVSLAVSRPVGNGIVQVLGEDFSTGGFPVVAAEDRGPVDVAAWSRHRSLLARWRTPVGRKATLTATARSYEEFRGNGTPYQRNGTRGKFASIGAVAQPTDNFGWEAVGYAQDQSYTSTFSGVNATRTAETPASDQFAVPATALGASWTGTWQHADEGTTGIGADVRTVHGETREHYLFANGDFTRLRVAGGSQLTGGLFFLQEQPIAPHLRLTLGARVDDWQDTNGHRREGDRRSGALSRDDHYGTRDGVEFSPSAGAVWTPAKPWRLHANLQQAFRRPTLNELYRPFRQGANVTEANADLRTEHVTSAEVGTEWSLWRAAPAPPRRSPTGMNFGQRRATPVLTLGATAFWDELRDAVANVTLAHGPGTFPVFGTLPVGGTGRERLNLDRTRVQGLELSATWAARDDVSVTANFLYNDATVRRAPVAPYLVGKRLAEVPMHAASVSASWKAPGRVTVTPRLRWIGRQFDDDENTLRLGEVVIVDLGLSRPLTPHLELFLDAENLANARVETARSADGIVNTGTPRFVFGGLRGRW